MPVVTPKRGLASTLTVYAVRYSSRLLSAIGVRPSWSTRSPVSARQINPPARFTMKVISSGVTSDAAQIRSPSFSRSSSSATMTSLPAAKSAIACSTVENGMAVREIGARRGESASSRGGIRGHELADVLPDHVRLDVHAVASAKRAERGVGPGVLDERQLKNPGSGERVHGQADTVDGDRAVGHHQRLQLVGQPQADQQGVVAPAHLLDDAHRVDVALHQVPAQPVAEPHCALEVDPAPGVPGADRRTLYFGEYGDHREPSRAVVAHREARAVHRDALAGCEPEVPRQDAQLAPRLRTLDTLDDADVVNQPGEHSDSSPILSQEGHRPSSRRPRSAATGSAASVAPHPPGWVTRRRTR